MRGVYWVRNDLRLHDNKALNSFLGDCKLGFFLWCPTQSYLRAGEIRKQFIDESLEHYSNSLSIFGQSLKTSNNAILTELEELYHKTPFESLYYTEAYSFEENKEELAVKNFCKLKSIQLLSFDQETLVHESDLPFLVSEMPFIFTDFRKKLEASLKIRSPVNLPFIKQDQLLPTAILSLHTCSSLVFKGGEQAALDRMKEYFWQKKAILSYKDTRNGMINWDDSTKFSPWLSLGLLSPRMIIKELRDFENQHGANESTYWLLFELFWRDYLKFFSRKYEHRIFIEDGVKKSSHYQSHKNMNLFLEWCGGKTSERFVNANMNELNQTGWMSNRGRQNVASYLVHHLKLPWTWGARYFENKLIDYDSDLNWGNWLYLSGNGSDPRARIFNIKRQAEVYDSELKYQNIWAPIL
ncbi:MAG: DASH family cryptochrome [Bacteriovorax sp.]|nr:DASH family cryptochrome [Bacteriovorax sp.]